MPSGCGKSDPNMTWSAGIPMSMRPFGSGSWNACTHTLRLKMSTGFSSNSTDDSSHARWIFS